MYIYMCVCVYVRTYIVVCIYTRGFVLFFCRRRRRPTRRDENENGRIIPLRRTYRRNKRVKFRRAVENCNLRRPPVEMGTRDVLRWENANGHLR